ncbi:hypothetical protein CEXT_111801 [Caerostris extrusa]|uniref:Secreted protein n=1 Tax=Caerostris extrusa TaxID=172846 RepID=A0AAV4Q5K8_CAEEX|nr:hypothetical protein CEXT_111801 [Caerostris extrusa]
MSPDTFRLMDSFVMPSTTMLLLHAAELPTCSACAFATSPQPLLPLWHFVSRVTCRAPKRSTLTTDGENSGSAVIDVSLIQFWKSFPVILMFHFARFSASGFFFLNAVGGVEIF